MNLVNYSVGQYPTILLEHFVDPLRVEPVRRRLGIATVESTLLEELEELLQPLLGGTGVVEQRMDCLHDRVVHIGADRVGRESHLGSLALAPVRVFAGHDSRRDADRSGPRRDVAHHHRVGADLRIVPDQDRAKDLGAGANHYVPAERRVPLLLLPPRCAAQRDAVIERAVVADLGGFANDDAHAVIDEHPPADDCARMDLDPGEPPAPMREPAGKPPLAPVPERMGDPAMPDQCVQPRVAGEHLPPGPSGRVAVEDDRDVFAKSAEHEGIFPYPSELLNYWVERSAEQDRGDDWPDDDEAEKDGVDDEDQKGAGEHARPWACGEVDAVDGTSVMTRTGSRQAIEQLVDPREDAAQDIDLRL